MLGSNQLGGVADRVMLAQLGHPPMTGATYSLEMLLVSHRGRTTEPDNAPARTLTLAVLRTVQALLEIQVHVAYPFPGCAGQPRTACLNTQNTTADTDKTVALTPPTTAQRSAPPPGAGWEGAA